MVNKMKYAIDRIENNIAVLENIETGEKKEINIIILPNNIKEGNILILENNKYKIDLTEEKLRRKRIEEKFNRLKKKD